MNRAWVRCRPDHLHDVLCDRCSTVAAGIRDYRLALRAAHQHSQTCQTEEE